MQSLAPVAARFGVVVSVVEPAAVATNIAANANTGALLRPDDPYRELGMTSAMSRLHTTHCSIQPRIRNHP
jgi:hypothetical protein